jgi:RHS repeat-associated protein
MKPFFRTCALASVLCLFLPRLSQATGDVGGDNPTGVTGEYNGSITTAGSYDPYTGNAKRFIDDLTVTGGVGDYPLKWTRILNTRGGSGKFGNGGGWRHSYQWGLSFAPPPNQCGPELPDATVLYPDGRKMNFRIGVQPDTYEDDSGGEPGDRLVHIAGTSQYHLKLKDGGRVEFDTGYGLTGVPQYIVDPYGQRTTLEYSNNGSGVYPSLSKIIEPAGRYLKIEYMTYPAETLYPSPVEVIQYVKAYDGLQTQPIETVRYDYERVNFDAGGSLRVRFYNLIHAVYDDGPPATYDYFPPGAALPTNPWGLAPGLVHTCDDVRYAGAMSKIEYEYLHVSQNPGCPVVWGQIRAEKNMTTHAVVSSVDYPSGQACRVNDPGIYFRTETRADGATRVFHYDTGFELDSYTDFAYYPGQPYHTTRISYPVGAFANPYSRAVTDARGYTTTLEKESNVGAVMAVIHNNGSRIQYHYTDDNDPYYVDSKTDENNKTTYYDRYCVGANPCDPGNANRLWRIRYPDDGFETFHYNNFGQVLTHRMTSGGTEQFTYTPRGLKETYTPPATASDPADVPTRYFYYDATNTAGRFDRIDRLFYVKDPLLHATTYDYNQRGQVITVRHHDNTFTQNQYYPDGTLHIATDELGHSTTYTYDEYKRVLSVENAEHEISRNSYDRGYNQDEHISLEHTTSSVYQTQSPMGKIVRHRYDANFRLIETTQAPGAGEDEAITSFTYDEVGNQVTVTRPNGQQGMPHPAHSTIAYDDRNRRTSLTDELDHTTEWRYDDVGNMKKEIRADTKFRTWDAYDAMNRIKHTTGFLSEPTSYDYDFAGNLRKTTDFKTSVYEITYDTMNRKESALYPLAGSGSEVWRYDAAGRVRYYKNTANQYKHSVYDERNRQTGSYWNSSETGTNGDQSIGDQTLTVFDYASRVTYVGSDSLSAHTSVSFGYDDANRKIWEDQTLNYDYAHTRRVETLPDDDGNRRTLSVAGVDQGYAFTYDYTLRQQLWRINKTGPGQYFVYTYDKNGNLKQRQDVLQGGDSTIFDYDRGNRVTLCVQTGVNNAAFSRSNYNDYDLVNNLKSITREEDQWKGERFEYDDANQLSSASYRVDVAPHAPEQPDPVPGQLGGVVEMSEDLEQKALAELVADPDREPLAQIGVDEPDAYTGPRVVTYLNDPINRLSMSDNGAVTIYTPNGLNQYTAVTNHTPLYDTKFSLSHYDDWTYTYDADKRLIWAGCTGDGGHIAQFVYDGLGRCVKRTIDGAATVFTYDEWKPIVEWTGAGVFVAWNLYGPGADEILVRWQPNTGGYLHYKLDPMGNVQFLLSGQNYGLEKYTYDAFGKPHIVGANGDVRGISLYGNRFLFTGREYLYTLGIYDYRHRLYHPGLGRFIQTDPIGFGGDAMNLYRYCSGNPILHGDPTGLQDHPLSDPLRDRIWDMAHWFDRDNALQGTFGHPDNLDRQAGVYTMALQKRDEGSKVYGHWADAGNSVKGAVGENVTANKQTESRSEIGQAEDGSERYVAARPHPGEGVGNVNGVGRVQHSELTTKFLPKGYKNIVGFVLGYTYYSTKMVDHDLGVARDRGYKGAIIMGPPLHSQQKMREVFYDRDTNPNPVY